MTISGFSFSAASTYLSSSSRRKPTAVETAIAVFVFEVGHGNGGIRRGPSINRLEVERVIKSRSGEEEGEAKAAGGAFSRTSDGVT